MDNNMLTGTATMPMLLPDLISKLELQLARDSVVESIILPLATSFRNFRTIICSKEESALIILQKPTSNTATGNSVKRWKIKYHSDLEWNEFPISSECQTNQSADSNKVNWNWGRQFNRKKNPIETAIENENTKVTEMGTNNYCCSI